MRAAAPEVLAPQELEALCRTLQAQMPTGVALAMTRAGGDLPALYPAESAAMTRAVPRRVAEFTAGRAAARMALSQLGVAAVAIPMGSDRAPVWPSGLCGSISHMDGLCIAVAAREGNIAALGIDVESAAALDADLMPSIATSLELRRMGGAPSLAAKRLFSAKEAAYKAQYPLSRRVFGFHTLGLAERQADTLTFRFSEEVPPFVAGSRIVVRQWETAGLCLSLSVLRR